MKQLIFWAVVLGSKIKEHDFIDITGIVLKSLKLFFIFLKYILFTGNAKSGIIRSDGFGISMFYNPDIL